MDHFIDRVDQNSKARNAAEYGVVFSVLLVTVIALLRVWGVIR